MPKFARGADALAAADAARPVNTGRFTPFISIKPGEKKYLQFLTPTDEIPGALLHSFVIVNYRQDDGSPVYASFISPRDRSLDGAGGYDELQSRFDLNPTYRLFAVAAELEPVTTKVSGKNKVTGFEPVMREWTDREGEDHQSLSAGIVVQSKDNFFSHLSNWEEETDDDMTKKIWAVSRDGNKKKPTYTFVASNVCDALDLSAYSEGLPDLDAYLEEISDPSRIKELISPLPDDHKISQFPTAKRKGSGPVRNLRSAPAERDEAPFETNEEKAAAKGGKYQALREKVKASAEEDD